MRSATIQINVVADEEPNACDLIVIRLANITLADTEIDSAIVDEVETLVKDSFAGTVVHMECGYLYASIPREDGSLIIDESKAILVDKAELRRYYCIEALERLITKVCSDRINDKLKSFASLPNAEIRVMLGEKLKLAAQLGDKRVELAEFTADEHDAIIKLIAAIARVLCSIAVIFTGATSDDNFLFIIGVVLGAICLAWLPEAVRRAMAYVHTRRYIRRLIKKMAAKLDKLRAADKKD